jgi:hypothetical protein
MFTWTPWLTRRTPDRTSPTVEPRFCNCTGDVRSDPFGMCLDCLRLIEPTTTATGNP